MPPKAARAKAAAGRGGQPAARAGQPAPHGGGQPKAKAKNAAVKVKAKAKAQTGSADLAGAPFTLFRFLFDSWPHAVWGCWCAQSGLGQKAVAAPRPRAHGETRLQLGFAYIDDFHMMPRTAFSHVRSCTTNLYSNELIVYDIVKYIYIYIVPRMS